MRILVLFFILFSFNALAQEETFDQDYDSIGELETLLKPVLSQYSVKPNDQFKKSDKIDTITLSYRYELRNLYHCYVFDSIYDPEKKTATLEVLYIEKNNYPQLEINQTFIVSTFQWNPNKWVYEGDTIASLRGCCATDLGLAVKKGCWPYDKSNGERDVKEDCIWVYINYHEVYRIKQLK